MTTHSLRVPDADRLTITARHFGPMWPLRIEPFIFSIARALAADYFGGLWTFYSIPEGFYMAPDEDRLFEVHCTGNFWSGTLSADALGIVCCMTAYSHLSFSKDTGFGQLMAQHYHALRAFAVVHPEAAEIMGATD